MMKLRGFVRTASLMVVAASLTSRAAAQEVALTPAEGTFADVAALAERAALVARVRIARMAQVEPPRLAGIRPGYGRFYIEGKTEALLTGLRPLEEP